MNAVIIVLWRPGDPWREQVWRYAHERWSQTGIRIVEADDPRGLWAARNTGARQAGDWDVALFTDADVVLAEPGQAAAALKLAADGGGYVSAYSELVTMGEQATWQLLAGGDEMWPDRVYLDSWSGPYAIGRPLWNELGGYDERFAPYHGQDIAIIHAASTLAHLERVPGRAIHLWHPRDGEQIGHPATGHPELWGRYKDATGDPAAMRELLAR